jgi:hypothetical protein
LLAVLVPERLPEIRRQLLIADAALLGGERLAREARFDVRGEPEGLGGVVELFDIRDRVVAHDVTVPRSATL